MRVLFVTNDFLGTRRAGPAIRCLELAKVVAREHDVTIATTKPTDLQVKGIRLLADTLRNPRALRTAAREAQIVVAQGLVLVAHPFLIRESDHLVIDLYDPYLFEYLAHPHPSAPRWGYLRQWRYLNQQLRRGDFFLCANERQRDYWLGRLCALARLTPEAYRNDVRFRALVAVVPFGLSSDPPAHTRPALKGVAPGISADDLLLIWAGGIWQWFDPLTVIRAMAAVGQRAPNVKLFFMATADPNADNRAMSILGSCRELATELGLLGRNVFFNADWVPFEERANYLLEADIGISAHLDTVEARFAFRTRVLDYIWAGLPMILTRGDYFAEFVEQKALGQTVAPGDVEGWTAAIISLANATEERRRIRDRLCQLAPEFEWAKVAEPLLEFCRKPYHTQAAPRYAGAVLPLLTFAFDSWRRLQSRFR
jgi:glycosyltransferase involved in cell wall biosynthesis